MQQYSLLSLKTFIAIVETGSFNKTAKLLGVSAAAVSRRISLLENALATHLINRTTRRLSLTEAGQSYYDDVKDAVNALNDSESKLKDKKLTIKGSIRIAAPMSFGIIRLARILPKFLKDHPEIDIDLRLEDQPANLFPERIDLAIRLGELRDSSLIGVHLGEVERIVCASPDYLKHNGEPSKMSDLKNHNCLQYSLGVKGKWGLSATATVPSQLHTNSGVALREAAIVGLGVIIVPAFIVEDAIKNGELKRILPNHKLQTLPLHIVRQSKQFTPVKVGAIIDFLKKELTPFLTR